MGWVPHGMSMSAARAQKGCFIAHNGRCSAAVAGLALQLNESTLMQNRNLTTLDKGASPRRGLIALAMTLSVLAMSTAAGAAHWGGMLGYSSDNILRGHSLSNGQPAWLADLHVEFDHAWVLGLGATAERPPLQSAGAQLTVYVDRRWRFGDDWVTKVGVVHYESPWNDFSDRLRYDELTLAIGYRGRWSASVAHSPDVTGLSERGRPLRGSGSFIESNFHQPISGRLAADIGLGYADYDGVGQIDYAFCSAGLRYDIGRVYLYATMLWANPSPQIYGLRADPRQRWVASVVWSF